MQIGRNRLAMIDRANAYNFLFDQQVAAGCLSSAGAAVALHE